MAIESSLTVIEQQARFFKTPAEWNAWLSKNGEKQHELWVGFYKKKAGFPSITWSESVDEALCYGWIDGIRKSLDEKRYVIRFTKRRKGSHWSKVNVDKMGLLIKEGRMKPAGLCAFEKRTEENTAKASFEQKQVSLDSAYQKLLKANKKANAYFKKQTPSYRKASMYWVMSAKRDETRTKRLEILIESCQNEEAIPPLRWPK